MEISDPFHWDGQAEQTVMADFDHAPPAARASRIAAQIFCGVSGMSRCAMPKGASASSTACTIVGGAPIAPLSPIPFLRRRAMG
jgi:hypothetical protein